MPDTKTKTSLTHFHTFAGGNGQVRLLIWSAGAPGGVSANVDLTEAEARLLAKELVDVASRLPRVVTAADLGLEAL